MAGPASLSNRSRPFFVETGADKARAGALALLTRIYKNDAQQSACGAAFSGDEWSIPMFRANFLCFAPKTSNIRAIY